MKLAGKPLREDYRQTLALPRPDGSSWSLTIRPLRLGFHQTLREKGIFPPAIPTRVARDSQGKPLRDAEGLAVLQREEADPSYLNAVEKYHQRVASLMVWEALQADEQLEFETPLPTTAGGWETFADQLHRELEQAGWSAGDLVWLCERIAVLSNLTGDHLREAQQHFFSSPGNTPA